jgi:PAT family beta-lactamase induction signal transducer AmpG
MLLLAKFLAGFSGLIVDASSYPVFFVYAAALGLPSIALILVLMRHETLALVEVEEQSTL